MKIKKLLEFTGWAVAVAGTSFLLSFANSEQNKTVCKDIIIPVSYTHLRAHETPEHLVCRLLLEKKKKHTKHNNTKI